MEPTRSAAPDRVARPARRAPPHLWLGLALVAVFWPLNWGLDGLRTHWGFFPMWLGYCLAVDGLNAWRRGTSLLLRGPRRYALLFAISVPLWWIFEALNLRTQNWHYDGREQVSDLTYALLGSLSFSTVVPAVLGSAELVAGLGVLRRFERGPLLAPGRRAAAALGLAGAAGLALLLAWPGVFFPFVWLAPYLLFEAINLSRGHRTLLDGTARGDWRPVVALCLGALLCAFFWEMWNALSYPKWLYRVPPFDFWHVFEMPLPGYLGYLPFSFEIFAAVHLALGAAGRGSTDYVLRGLAPGPAVDPRERMV